MQYSIVSLIPADDWFAVSKSEKHVPLIAWAVIAYMNEAGEVTEERIHGMIFHDGLFIRAEMHGEFDRFVRDPGRNTRTIDRARLHEILKREYHLKDKDIKGHLINRKFNLLLDAVAKEDVSALMDEVTITDEGEGE